MRRFPPLVAAFSSTRSVAWVAVLWVLVFSAAFLTETVSVRNANSDDVLFDAVVSSGRALDFSVGLATEQGRFYVPIAFAPVWGLYSLQERWAFAAVRAGLLLFQVGAAGVLVARLARAPLLGLAFGVLALALLQLPRSFYGVLSYPQIALGFGLTCLVLSVLLGAGERTRPWILAPAVFAACCMNEVFCAPLAFGLLAAGWRERRATSPILAAGAALAVYAICYVGFRLYVPGTYGGTTLSLRPVQIVMTVARQGAAILPGFELVFHRNGFLGGRPFKTLDEVAAILAGVNVFSALWAAAGVALAFRILKLSSGGLASDGVRSGWIPLGLGVASLIPMALTEKYQIWSYQRQYPYVYSLHFSFFCTAAFVLGCAWFLQAFPRRRGPAPSFRALFIILGVLAIGVSASNRQVLTSLAAEAYPSPAELGLSVPETGSPPR